jgi:hypothetical protein
MFSANLVIYNGLMSNLAKILVANAPTPGLSVFLYLALGILTPVCGWADAEPRYVVFQFQGMESDAPTEPDLPGLVAELEERFGAHPAGTGRHVGFTPGRLKRDRRLCFVPPSSASRTLTFDRYVRLVGLSASA